MRLVRTSAAQIGEDGAAIAVGCEPRRRPAASRDAAVRTMTSVPIRKPSISSRPALAASPTSIGLPRPMNGRRRLAKSRPLPARTRSTRGRPIR